MSNGFYRLSEEQLYLTPADFRIMTDQQLNDIVEAGLVVWDKHVESLRKAAAQKRRKIGAMVIVAVAGAAVLSAGPSAAAPAVESGAAVGAGTAAGGTAASSSSLFAEIQSVASYVSKGAAVVAKATGSDTANKLASAANLIGSPNMGAAIERGVEYQLQQEGLKINPKDTAAQMALQEKIAREQERYAASLRQLAEQEAAASGTVVTVEPPKPVTKHDILPYVIPALLTVLLS